MFCQKGKVDALTQTYNARSHHDEEQTSSSARRISVPNHPPVRCLREKFEHLESPKQPSKINDGMHHSLRQKGVCCVTNAHSETPIVKNCAKSANPDVILGNFETFWAEIQEIEESSREEVALCDDFHDSLQEDTYTIRRAEVVSIPWVDEEVTEVADKYEESSYKELSDDDQLFREGRKPRRRRKKLVLKQESPDTDMEDFLTFRKLIRRRRSSYTARTESPISEKVINKANLTRRRGSLPLVKFESILACHSNLGLEVEANSKETQVIASPTPLRRHVGCKFLPKPEVKKRTLRDEGQSFGNAATASLPTETAADVSTKVCERTKTKERHDKPKLKPTTSMEKWIQSLLLASTAPMRMKETALTETESLIESCMALAESTPSLDAPQQAEVADVSGTNQEKATTKDKNLKSTETLTELTEKMRMIQNVTSSPLIQDKESSGNTKIIQRTSSKSLQLSRWRNRPSTTWYDDYGNGNSLSTKDAYMPSPPPKWESLYRKDRIRMKEIGQQAKIETDTKPVCSGSSSLKTTDEITGKEHSSFAVTDHATLTWLKNDELVKRSHARRIENGSKSLTMAPSSEALCEERVVPSARDSNSSEIDQVVPEFSSDERISIDKDDYMDVETRIQAQYDSNITSYKRERPRKVYVSDSGVSDVNEEEENAFPSESTNQSNQVMPSSTTSIDDAIIRKAICDTTKPLLYQNVLRQSDDNLAQKIQEQYNASTCVEITSYFLLRNGKSTNFILAPQRPVSLDFVTDQKRTLWQSAPLVRASGCLNTMTKKRLSFQEALYEILSTEGSYMYSLLTLERVIKGVKTRVPQFVSDMKFHSIFSSFLPIIEATKDLTIKLKQLWKSDIMLTDLCAVVEWHYKKNRGIYVNYSRYLESILDDYKKEMCEDRTFKAVINGLLDRENLGGLPLDSFLSLPMQRVTRMPLLLKSVLVHADPESPDIIKYTSTLLVVQELAHKCDSAVEQMRRWMKMQEISNTLDFSPEISQFPLLSFKRYLVLDCQAKKVAMFLVKEKIHLYLFNDMFIYAKQVKDQLLIRDHCLRQFLTCERTSQPLTVQFHMKVSWRGNEKTMTVIFDKALDLKRWLAALDPTSGGSSQSYDNMVVALRSFLATRPDEISLEIGDTVLVSEEYDGLLYGERLSAEGVLGWFPADHCEKIESPDIREMVGNFCNQVQQKRNLNFDRFDHSDA